MEDKKETVTIDKVYILYHSYKENRISSEEDEWEISEVFAHQEHLDSYLDKYDIILNKRYEQGWKYKVESYSLYKKV